MPLLYVLILITSLVCPSFTQVIVQFDKSMFTLGVNILLYSKNNFDVIFLTLLPSYSAFVCLYDGSWTNLNFIKDIFIHERPSSVLLCINLCAYIFTRFIALRGWFDAWRFITSWTYYQTCYHQQLNITQRLLYKVFYSTSSVRDRGQWQLSLLFTTCCFSLVNLKSKTMDTTWTW